MTDCVLLMCVTLRLELARTVKLVLDSVSALAEATPLVLTLALVVVLLLVRLTLVDALGKAPALQLEAKFQLLLTPVTAVQASVGKLG